MADAGVMPDRVVLRAVEFQGAPEPPVAPALLEVAETLAILMGLLEILVILAMRALLAPRPLAFP